MLREAALILRRRLEAHHSEVACSAAVLLTLVLAVDVMTNAASERGTAESHLTAQSDRARLPRLISRTAQRATVYRAQHLRPFLESALEATMARCNQTLAQTVALRLNTQAFEQQVLHYTAMLVSRGKDGATRSDDSAPWYASKRRVEPNVRKVDYATLTSVIDQHATSLLSADRLDSIRENATYATNTLDKLIYQLHNFEPMVHRFSSPQWNGVSLTTQRKLGATYPKGFMIGISSVNRQTNYLVATLISILTALTTEEERRLVHIVVFNGNYPPSQHEDIAAVRMQFASEISTGMIEIVELKHPHPQLHDPSSLTRRWGDELSRVLWRSKQVLDVAYLMEYCTTHSLGYQYFLMMEDDIIASKNFALRLRRWVDAHMLSNTEWTMLSFYNPWPVIDMEQLPPKKFFGVIGQLFRMHDLPVVVEFLRKNFDQSPLDWLFVDFLKKVGGSIVVHTPSLFQHQGTVSSLEGKTQEGRSVDFQESE